MNALRNLTLTLVVAAGTAFAGPPLICHPYLIGNDTSLPWGTDTKSWDNPDPQYDKANLTADTLKLLDSRKALLTRMETLRRAAIYSGKNPAIAFELSNRLMARALTAELKGQNGLALFDAGYFVESMKQLSLITKSTAFHEIDGYEIVKRSLPGLEDKLTAEYALGLIRSDTTWPNEHLRRAVAGAQEGSLLAKNLLRHYPNKNLAAVKQTLVAKSAAR